MTTRGDMAGHCSMGEFDLIAWFRQRSGGHPQIPLGIGDDCALIRPTIGREVLVTTDMLMDGRHFRLGEATPAEVGFKALGVNLSDIAAMAGIPLAAFVSVALPRPDPVATARGVFEGMQPLAARFGVALAGGDTNAWDGPLVINVTLLGETNPNGAVRRSGARVGDVIAVTGPLGGSLASGRHLRPAPRVREAQRIAERVTISAMIDLSDGLASDLGHILAESGNLGADLDPALVPIHPDAATMARSDGRSPMDHALRDGEDFELCLALAPADWDDLNLRPIAGLDLKRVGTITPGGGIRLLQADGSAVPLVGKGFDHLTAAPRSGS